MKAKKLFAMLLSAAMVASMTTVPAFAEDVLEADLSDIIPEETVTLDVYDQLANYSGEQIGWFAQVMLEKFNVTLNIIPESDGVSSGSRKRYAL